ncbi:1-acyl-sn-glycerol-3-phosphate acyltransferase [Candidatus Woesearchaeota archaeon]|nr:1-acyl-sn-glycerol-3-phosphate acyltransferase [Candidatus Woesearchaeota archaeon]MBW3017939.1 1-acyl-sn-glycerol-3-phosphate acyltransferase [Candidatus Woesearchaeota archaeon]
MAGSEPFIDLAREKTYGYWEPLYNIGRILCTTYFRSVMNADVKDAHHVPREGPFVIYSNHRNVYDPPILGHAFPRKTHYMGKEELFHIPVFKSLIRLLGCFPVNRENPSSLTLKIIAKIIEDDEGFIMFPQGTRTKGELKPEQFQSVMTKFLLRQSQKNDKNIAIVPAYVDYFAHGVNVRFSAPFFTQDYLPVKKETPEKLTELVAKEIIDLSKRRFG